MSPPPKGTALEFQWMPPSVVRYKAPALTGLLGSPTRTQPRFESRNQAPIPNPSAEAPGGVTSCQLTPPSIVLKMNLFVIIHPFCASNMWIDEIESGTTFGKPSNGGAEMDGGAVISMTAVGIVVGEVVVTGLNIDTFA